MENHLHCPVCLSGILADKIRVIKYPTKGQIADCYMVFLCDNYDCQKVFKRKNLEKIEIVFENGSPHKTL